MDHLPPDTLRGLPVQAKRFFQAKYSEELRQYVAHCLATGNDLKLMYDLLSQDMGEYFVDIACEMAKTDSDWAQFVLPALVATGKISEKVLNEFFPTACEKAAK